MVKGVNRQVLEIRDPGSPYFERAFFFVKPEYAFTGEQTLRPIVNVRPDEDDVYRNLCHLVEHRDDVPRLSRESRLYVERHHDYRLVARAYLDFWRSRIDR